jgi:hypothetical protein
MNPDHIISSSPDEKVYRTTVPNKNDVLCGRGGTINSHPGNEQYRSIVDSKKRVYLTARFKREKRLIATSIVDQIRNMDPPGRFLQKDADKQTWFDIGEEKSREKTSQALRENSKDVRIQMENEYYEAKRQQAREVAIAAGKDPDEAVKGLPTGPSTAASIATAQRRKQKQLEQQQQQLAQQQKQIAKRQQQIAQQQQQLAQEQIAQQRWNPGHVPLPPQHQQPQDKQIQQQMSQSPAPPAAHPSQWTYNSQPAFNTQGRPGQVNLQQPPSQNVASNHGSFYHQPTQQNPHPRPDQQYTYAPMFGSTLPSQEQIMMPHQQPPQQQMPTPQNATMPPSQEQQQIMPPPQKRVPHHQQQQMPQRLPDPLTQQQPMFQGGSYLTDPIPASAAAPGPGVRHVPLQQPAGPNQGHPESFGIGGDIPLVIKPKKRSRSRKIPPHGATSAVPDSTYLTPNRGVPSPRETGIEQSPDESTSKSVMSGLLTAKTGDSLSYYLQAMEDEISGDVGQEVELVSHGLMQPSQPSNPLPPAQGGKRRHTKSKDRAPSNSGKVQVDWATGAAGDGSLMASTPPLASPRRSPPQQSHPFSPEHSLDLEKMSLAGTENISQAGESIGGASLLNVFNDNNLSPLRPQQHAMSLGDASVAVPSLGLSNIGDHDSMMGISVLLDNSVSVRSVAQHADDQGSMMGASAMSVESGRVSGTSGSRSSSSKDRSASPASFNKTNPGEGKEYNPAGAGTGQSETQSEMQCNE